MSQHQVGPSDYYARTQGRRRGSPNLGLPGSSFRALVSFPTGSQPVVQRPNLRGSPPALGQNEPSPDRLRAPLRAHLPAPVPLRPSPTACSARAAARAATPPPLSFRTFTPGCSRATGERQLFRPPTLLPAPRACHSLRSRRDPPRRARPSQPSRPAERLASHWMPSPVHILRLSGAAHRSPLGSPAPAPGCRGLPYSPQSPGGAGERP